MKRPGDVSQDDHRPADETAPGALRVYARDGDTRIRLIADGSGVPDAERQYDVCFVSSPQEATDLAAICAGYLADAKMPADAHGWHTFPASSVPNLLRAARNLLWVKDDVLGADEQLISPAISNTPAASKSASRRAQWTRAREARTVFLAGMGLTAKQIAADPIVASTPEAVYGHLRRLGIHLTDAPRGRVSFQLPLDSTIVIDKAAAAVGSARDLFLRRYIIRATKDPARFGLVVVS